VWKWCKRHLGAVSLLLAVIVLLLSAVVVIQAVLLHADGWRVAWGTMPDWLAAVGGVATVGALFVAWRVYLHAKETRDEDETLRDDAERKRQDAERRQQAELITVWIIKSRKASFETVIEVGLINSSKGLAYNVQIEVIGAADDPTLVFKANKSVARASVRVLPPGKWVAEMVLSDKRLNPVSTDIYFRDQAMNEWNRDERLGTLSEASGGPLFWATAPDSDDDKERREQEGPLAIDQQQLKLRPHN
jgi:hypothetical protein